MEQQASREESTEGRAGVGLEAAGPAQLLVVYNLQRNWLPSGKAVVSGETLISCAFPTAQHSSGTSRLAGQPDSSAGGPWVRARGLRPVLHFAKCFLPGPVFSSMPRNGNIRLPSLGC